MARIGALVDVLDIGNFCYPSYVWLNFVRTFFPAFYMDRETGAKALISYVEACQPTAIVINWCYTKGGNMARLLYKSGICGQMILENERVLLTGNNAILMDCHQKKFIEDSAAKINRPKSILERLGLRRGHGLAFLAYGPSGEGWFIYLHSYLLLFQEAGKL